MTASLGTIGSVCSVSTNNDVDVCGCVSATEMISCGVPCKICYHAAAACCSAAHMISHQYRVFNLFQAALDNLQAPICIVAVHAKTAELLAATSSVLGVWTINGVLLGLSSPCHSDITALAYSCSHDWDEDNVFVTGHADGSVCFWSLRMGATETATCGTLQARALCLRCRLSVSAHAVSSLLLEEAEPQTMWIGDVKGSLFRASVGSAAPVVFNSLATASNME